MKNSTYEVRLAEWSSFRQSLETSNDPIQDVIDYYKQVPVVSIHTDPYDMSSWPDPWELVYENEYCEYCILLGMCYTFTLTARFKETHCELYTSVTAEKDPAYMCVIDDKHILGLNHGAVTTKNKLPQNAILLWDTNNQK